MPSPDSRPETVLKVQALTKRYPHHSAILHRRTGHLDALKGVDLEARTGHTTALVGESGSGKSTLARCIVGLERPSGGSIQLGGMVLDSQRLSYREISRHVQIVFQDPNTSLSPHMSILRIVEEPLIVHKSLRDRKERSDRAEGALDSVGIARMLFSRRPHELSGGQRQRVAIARALVLRPKLLVLDEPVSALDVSVQAQILVLLRDLQRDYGTAFLFISHDLAVVRAISHEVYVMSHGEVVESGKPSDILSSPKHPYTAQLLRSEPSHPAWDPDGPFLDESQP